ncbi:hypothetical protein [Pedobacter jamesrossensis]|uniref:Uncharacterized protein n=1 Tax=Pedobacter jamesrossensis TaxID=1908238 RepID=A0ABV8NNT7_9SPHI
MRDVKTIHSKGNQHFLLFAILFCSISSALFYLFNFNNLSLASLILAGLFLVKKNLSDVEKETKTSKAASPFHC